MMLTIFEAPHSPMWPAHRHESLLQGVHRGIDLAATPDAVAAQPATRIMSLRRSPLSPAAQADKRVGGRRAAAA